MLNIDKIKKKNLFIFRFSEKFFPLIRASYPELKMDGKTFIGCLTILIGIISSYGASIDPPLTSAATSNPLSHLNSTGN